LTLLICVVILVIKSTGVNIPVALGLFCPPFGLIWYATQRERHLVGGKPIIFMVNQVISSFTNLRNETLMFVAANVFGIGIGIDSVVPTENISILLDLILPLLDLRIVVLTFLFLGFIGLHPIIVVMSFIAIL
jgi:hypothetical protein